MSRSLAKIFDMVDNNPFEYEIIFPGWLKKIFELEFGYVLLVKGDAGTGKTTFAMEVCIEKMKDSRIIFLSTRSNIAEFKRQYSWFIEEVGGDKVKDLDSIEISEDKMKMLNIDSNMFFRIFMEFENLIKSYKEEENAEKGEKKGETLVIVDSIEKIYEIIKKQNVLMTETAILESFITLARRYGLKLILISETAEKNKDDYLVDGIITLEKDYSAVPDRILRYMKVDKLRNIDYEQQIILFTLYQGRFRALPGQKPRITLLPPHKRIKYFHKVYDGKLLNQYFFMNLLNAKKLHLDFESQIGDVLNSIHLIFIINCLLNRKHVFYMCPPENMILEIAEELSKIFGEEFLNDYFRIGYLPRTSLKGNTSDLVLSSQSKNIFEELKSAKNVLDNFRSQRNYSGTLVVMSLDYIFHSYDKHDLPTLLPFLFNEGVLTGDDVLLASSVRYNDMDPQYMRFCESFSSKILFYMRGIQFAKINVVYWVKMPQTAYALFPVYDKGFKIDRVDFLPLK
ncbi:MAG: RAD55 family ATPase [Candidatus Hodarchaeota archaeon]